MPLCTSLQSLDILTRIKNLVSELETYSFMSGVSGFKLIRREKRRNSTGVLENGAKGRFCFLQCVKKVSN
jgi:hypothetical protein